MNARDFVQRLEEICLPNVFNPYRDLCPDFDRPDAAIVRRKNLINYLEVFSRNEVGSIWLGRDCGYRGGRRTGIALTDEIHLPYLDQTYGRLGLRKATVGEPVKERTATEIWRMIRAIGQPVILWNVFPFHPFEAGNPMSNRAHSRAEFKEVREILAAFLEWMKPKRIIGLGADAQDALRRLGYKVFPVRHPSFGGHIDFANQIRAIYGIEIKRSEAALPLGL